MAQKKKSYKDIVNLEVLSIQEIIDSNLELIIPAYQRGYRWDDSNVKKLLDDVLSAFEKKDDYYYIGPIYLIDVKTKNNTFSIVDGQQRMTTFNLIINCLSNRNQKIPQLNIKHTRYEERIAFEQKIKKGQQNLSIYLDKANKSINKFFDENFDNSQLLDNFVEYLIRNVCVVKINVKDEKVSNNLFESLNYKGKKLKIIDLIRNYFFIKVSSKNYEFFSQVWEELESILNELMPFDDNRMFDTIAKDLFSNFLICNSGKHITDVNLYESVKEEFENLNENEVLKKFKEILVDDNRKFIRSYVASLRSSFIFWENIPEINKEKLKALTDKQVLRSTLCALAFSFESKNISTSFITSFIEDLYSLFCRTMSIGNIPVSKFSEIFAFYSNQIWKMKRQDNCESIAKELLFKLLDNSKIYPNKVFADNLKITSFSDINKARRLLIDIETSFNKEIKISSNLFVNKVFNNKAVESWNLFNNETGSIYENRLGNFFLADSNIDEKYNFARLKEILDKVNLRVNEKIVDQEYWNPDCIIKRTSLLTNKSLATWKFNMLTE
ncbi:MAG: DUF262 domain-containing protein [Flavobacteriales bacterium]|nr:DUF262 domain-containing protein [Flavobacteriales bacterium]